MEAIGWPRASRLALMGLIALSPFARVRAEETSLPTLAFDPVTEFPTLGADHHVDLTFQVASALPPGDVRVGANVGTIVSVTPRGNRAFVVRLDLPEKRFPQVAIVGATVEIGHMRASGFTLLPLKALASPAFETDPGAMVTLKVGEKVFGPIRAGQDGQVRVPVVVPPGISSATARSTGAGGKSTEQTIDLGLPDFPRMLVLQPASVAAGRNATIELFALGPGEQPADPATLSLWYGSRRLTALDRKPGHVRFLFSAPATIGDAVLQARRSNPGTATSTHQTTLRVRAAEIEKLQITAVPRRLAIGSAEQSVLKIAALDPWGNIRHTQPPALFVDGVPWSVRANGDESYVAEISAPGAYDGRSRLGIEASVAGHHAHEEIELDGVPEREESERTVNKRRELGDSPLSVSVLAGLTPQSLESASPWYAAQIMARVPRSQRLFAGIEIGRLSTRLSASDELGISRSTIVNLPLLLGASAVVFRVPRFLVLAGVAAGLSATYFRTTSFGETDATRSFGPAWKASLEGAVALGPGQALLAAQYLWFDEPEMRDTVTLVGNTGGIGMTIGYRWLF